MLSKEFVISLLILIMVIFSITVIVINSEELTPTCEITDKPVYEEQ